MVAIPTMEEEDAEAPEPRAREPCQRAFTHCQPHEECACPSRDPGDFKPHLRKAPERSSMSADSGGHGPTGKHHRGLRRDMARLALVREQISSIEKTRAEPARAGTGYGAAMRWCACSPG